MIVVGHESKKGERTRAVLQPGPREKVSHRRRRLGNARTTSRRELVKSSRVVPGSSTPTRRQRRTDRRPYAISVNLFSRDYRTVLTTFSPLACFPRFRPRDGSPRNRRRGRPGPADGFLVTEVRLQQRLSSV